VRSRDKLQEARFFLNGLRRSRGKLPRAAYYASATIGALRSVTWVLQSDLRSKFGERFDTWWQRQTKVLGQDPTAFSLVKESRNSATKHGVPLARRAVRKVYEAGAVSSLQFIVDPFHETNDNLRIELRAGHLEKIPDGATEEEYERMGNRLIEDAQDILAKMRDFGRAWAADEVEYETVLGIPPGRFDETLAVLTNYLRSLERLLANAQQEFAA
jgi:hypothetical protein